MNIRKITKQMPNILEQIYNNNNDYNNKSTANNPHRIKAKTIDADSLA